MIQFFDFGPSPTHSLDYVVSKMDASAEAIKSQGFAYDSLIKRIMGMVEHEAPSFQPFFEKIIKNYNALTNAYYSCSDDVKRAADDLRDITARTPVYVRLQREIESLKKKLASAESRFDGAYKSLDQLVPQSVTALRDARVARIEAAQNLHDAFAYYQKYSANFARFKFLRTKSAFMIYGKALETRGALELPMHNAIIMLLKSIKDHIKNPEAILSIYKAPPAPPPKAAEPAKTSKSTNASEDPKTTNRSKTTTKRGKSSKDGKRRGRPLRRRGGMDQAENDDEEIEIDGFMYDVLEKKDDVHHEEEEKEKAFEFDEDGIDYSVQITQKLPEPKPFNPEIDESTLDIKSIRKEIFNI